MSAFVTQPPTRAALDGVPWIDVAGSLRAAVLSGRRITRILGEAAVLRRGPGQLTLAEYCYYRLWDSDLPLAEKRRFVGKRMQPAMHLACNNYAWNVVTEDKLIFHAAATSMALPTAALLAIAHPTRQLFGIAELPSEDAIVSFLRDPTTYPFFAKPIDGVYSLGVISADRIDAEGVIHLADGTTRPAIALAAEIAAAESGTLIQRRLVPGPETALRFGTRLCSLRMVVLLTEGGPLLLRAVLKLPATGSIADNFWRPGNMIAAVNVETGCIERTVRGTGMEMETDFAHPETRLAITGTAVPDWHRAVTLVHRAALMLPGVTTQAWDVALTDDGPVLLEANWGGDMNLAQLAYGRGMMCDAYAEHLGAHEYDARPALERVACLRVGTQRGMKTSRRRKIQ